MTLHNVKPWLMLAQEKGFALGAFNANTMEQMQAIIRAADAEQAPVIIQVSHNALRYVGEEDTTLGLRYMAQIGKIAAHSVTIPVSLHLDHAGEVEVLQAIDLGFTSVMFDGATLPYDENVATAQRLVEAAHRAGVFIEAELGEVPRARDVTSRGPQGKLTDPDEAARFVAETGVDALAVAIGSVHAVTEKQVELDLELLKELRAKVAVPLVLHGSSGVTDAHIRQGIQLGLCKVNVATQLNKAFTGAVRKTLTGDESMVDPRKYLGPARAAMVAATRERIRLFGAANRASPGII